MAWSLTGSPAAAGKQGGNTQNMFRKHIGTGRIGIRAAGQNSIGNRDMVQSKPITIMPDGTLWVGNQRVGYLDESDVLFGMNRSGYAVQIGPSDRRTACDMLREWLKP